MDSVYPSALSVVPGALQRVYGASMDEPTPAHRVKKAYRDLRRLKDEEYDRRIRSAAGVSAGLNWEAAQRVIMRLPVEVRRGIAAEVEEWYDAQIAALNSAAKARGWID